MIALLTTYLIVTYILISGVFFRIPAGFFVKLRLFQLTKAQEATFGVAVSVLPFIVAWVFVWNVPIARNFPFRFANGTVAAYRQDYRLALTLVVAEDPSRLLQSNYGNLTLTETAITNIGHRQARFLSWYYLLIGIEGTLFGFLAHKYGDWSHRSKLYDWFARKILLPNVSEWQLLLSDFGFPKHPKRIVVADVLCGDRLYRGEVGDYFLDTAGHLSGIFIKNVERFRRSDLELARQKPGNESVAPDTFWRKIPGSNFYIPADQINNLNVRFPYYDDRVLEEFIRKSLQDLRDSGDLQTDISVSFEEPRDSE